MKLGGQAAGEIGKGAGAREAQVGQVVIVAPLTADVCGSATVATTTTATAAVRRRACQKADHSPAGAVPTLVGPEIAAGICAALGADEKFVLLIVRAVLEALIEKNVML